jgi:glycosyltransferase involved in cell wall biosynthesis
MSVAFITSAPLEPIAAAGRQPRLLVISDCSVEASVSGQLLLYRLLQGYAPEDLMVVEGDIWPSEPARRLPGVSYQTVHYMPWRYSSRLYSYWNAYLLWGIRRWLEWAVDLANERRAEAVLTVAHGHLWILAATVAKRLNIPLHVAVHDDWPSITMAPAGFRPILHRMFRNIYRQAASRLCVSPFMEAEYRRRYECGGTVLWPSRADDMPAGRVQVRDNHGPFVLAFAGSLPNADYSRRLRGAADAVASVEGILDIYTNASQVKLVGDGLERSCVRLNGFLPPRELIERLSATADVLFVPISFRPEDRTTMELAFPSKLTDYTSAGLPILIWGPKYSAAARWAAENPGAALCVTDPDPARLAAAVRRLSENVELRRELAAGAVAVGERQFTFAANSDLFQNCLLRGQSL